MQPPIFTREKGVARVRVRYGWMGKCVLQAQFNLVRVRVLGPSEVVEEPWGVTSWRDVKRNDILLTAQYLREVQEVADAL
jgi:hypothetical protein